MIRKWYMFLFLCLLLALSPANEGLELLSRNQADISVEVKGAVSEPGVYYLPAFSTVNDLLALVKLQENADLSTINLTTALKDQDVLVIPVKSEQPLISINSADLQQLMTLPHIGEVTAQRIIDYRNEHGLFQHLEDLKAVKGIGEKIFAQIAELIQL